MKIPMKTKIWKNIHHKFQETKYTYYTGMKQREDFIEKTVRLSLSCFSAFFPHVFS